MQPITSKPSIMAYASAVNKNAGKDHAYFANVMSDVRVVESRE